MKLSERESFRHGTTAKPVSANGALSFSHYRKLHGFLE